MGICLKVLMGICGPPAGPGRVNEKRSREREKGKKRDEKEKGKKRKEKRERKKERGRKKERERGKKRERVGRGTSTPSSYKAVQGCEDLWLDRSLP
jgi:hypothetical protein